MVCNIFFIAFQIQNIYVDADAVFLMHDFLPRIWPPKLLNSFSFHEETWQALAGYNLLFTKATSSVSCDF